MEEVGGTIDVERVSSEGPAKEEEKNGKELRLAEASAVVEDRE